MCVDAASQLAIQPFSTGSQKSKSPMASVKKAFKSNMAKFERKTETLNSE
jgi:hypothetical protein